MQMNPLMNQCFLKTLQAQVEAGVHGVIIGGSLGEASTLLNEEKIMHYYKLPKQVVPDDISPSL
jgi:dihydrodipicolinate synthase/N-acetylneuraminate lyase